MNRCRVPDCNGVTEYDDSAQAVLCTTCGVVAAQDILADHDGEICGSNLYFGPTTLKSLRRAGGVLPGQSNREDRDRRNTVAMHQYITTLLGKLVCSGLAPRAHSLFDQGRIRGKYRWGRKAVLVAGGCIAITLRENNKGVTMSHLASLMDISPYSLCRVLTQISAVLGLQVPAFDPVALLPSLQSHLQALLSSPTCPLPHAIVELIQPLPPAPILQLATSLATLVANSDSVSSPSVSAPGTACALLILALEGQAALSLPSYALLAQELGTKVGMHKNLVVARYRDIRKVIDEWMRDVPWILGADHSDNKLGKKRRKTSQRDMVAMGLKDVVQFQEDILKVRRGKGTEPSIRVSLDATSDDENWESDAQCSQVAVSSLGPRKKRRRLESVEADVSSTKYPRLACSKRTKPLTRLDLASLALLSPSHPLVSDMRAQRPLHISETDGIQTQILTSAAFPTGFPFTRLQRLVALRGGEREIEDEELFEKGELEGLLRTENEAAALRDLFEWNSPEQCTDTQQKPLGFLPDEDDWALDGLTVLADHGRDKNASRTESGEQVLGEWREASPFDQSFEETDRFDTGCR